MYQQSCLCLVYYVRSCAHVQLAIVEVTGGSRGGGFEQQGGLQDQAGCGRKQIQSEDVSEHTHEREKTNLPVDLTGKKRERDNFLDVGTCVTGSATLPRPQDQNVEEARILFLLMAVLVVDIQTLGAVRRRRREFCPVTGFDLLRIRPDPGVHTHTTTCGNDTIGFTALALSDVGSLSLLLLLSFRCVRIRMAKYLATVIVHNTISLLLVAAVPCDDAQIGQKEALPASKVPFCRC